MAERKGKAKKIAGVKVVKRAALKAVSGGVGFVPRQVKVPRITPPTTGGGPSIQQPSTQSTLNHVSTLPSELQRLVFSNLPAEHLNAIANSPSPNNPAYHTMSQNAQQVRLDNMGNPGGLYGGLPAPQNNGGGGGPAPQNSGGGG
jgi:hypothetical protein